jgi:8-oxo-dGTP pyrophosphatase MutT (NUDIX family)
MSERAASACRSTEPRHSADEYGRRVGNANGQHPDELRTKVHGERVLYDNPWVRLTLVDVEPPDGRRFEHHVVRLFRVAIALVLNDKDEVLMLWRHRFVADAWGWELPGGIIDGDEDGTACAAREAEEETGWRPGAMTHLVTYQPMIGMVDSLHEIYVGHGATLAGEPSDPEEAGRVEWIPMASILGMISRNEIIGSGSLVGLLHVLASRAGQQSRASGAIGLAAESIDVQA